jgi:hypothetical protein
MDSPGLSKLEGTAETKAAGEFVLKGMELASKEGFGHVAKVWYKKTLDYKQGLEQVEKDKAQTEDILASVKDIVPTVNKEGKFALAYRDGREFLPTEHAIMQMGNWGDCGTWFVQNLLKNPVDKEGREIPELKRDRQDAETLVTVFKNGFRRLDQSKKFLWRTRKDGSLRAMLTERYAIVDNRWFIERLAEFIPGGRLSHWRGDGDTIYGNVLIPDTIREETDSDYGGMLSVGNSEIGIRRVSSVPSIFRAICMNGCIWGQTKGEGIRQVHRGKIDLRALALEIKENLNKQIPLLPQGIDRLLGIRSYAWDGGEMKPLFAQVAKDYGFSKRQASDTLRSYHVERNTTPDYAKTLFGVVNSVTRAGQKLSNAEWIKFDEVGGQLAQYAENDWDRLVSKAKQLKTKEVEETFLATV